MSPPTNMKSGSVNLHEFEERESECMIGGLEGKKREREKEIGVMVSRLESTVTGSFRAAALTAGKSQKKHVISGETAKWGSPRPI